MADSKEPSRFANSFNRNIITWSAVSVMAVMITLVAVALHEEYAALIREAASDTEIRARLLEENARQSMRRVELLATQAAADVMRGDDFPGTDLSDLRRRLRLHLPADGLVSAFAIVGRDGATILSTDTLDPRSLPSAAERDYFTAQRDNSGLGMVVGDPAAYGVHGNWAMPISLRISGPGGTFLGVLVAQVEAVYFQPFYDSVHTGVGGFVTMFTRTGWFVARSPSNEAILRRNVADSPMFREDLPASKARTVRRVVVTDGVERIFSYRALEDFALIVSVGEPLTDILAPWRKDAWRGAILLAVILVVLAGGASRLSREMRRRELAEAAARSEHDRLELTTSAVGVATWDYDLASGEVIITGALDKIIAHSSRAVRTRFSDLIKLLHPEDVQPVRHALVELVKGLRTELVVEHRMRERSGEWRWLSTRATVVGRDAAGRAVRLVGTNHDVTERKHSEAILALENSVVRHFAESPDPVQAKTEVIRAICETTHWACGRYLWWDADGGLLRFRAGWGIPEAEIQRYLEESRDVTYAPGVGIVGWTWQSRQPLWVADLAREPRVLRLAGAQAAGLRSALSVPVLSEGKAVGVLILHDREVREADERMLGTIQVLATLIGQYAQRANAEQALRESAARLRTANQQLTLLFESSPLAIYSRDADGLLTSWNPAAEKMFGWKAAEVLGKRLPTVPDEEHAVSDRYRMRLTGGEAFIKQEARRLRRDGYLIDVDTFLAPLRDDAGNFNGFITIAADITERKQAESELIGVLEAAPDAMVLVNGDGNIVLLNSGVENLFGFAKHELIGKSVDLLIPERLRHGHRGFRKQYFAEAKTRAMGAGKSLIGLRKNGSEFPAEISLSMLKTHRGGLAIAAIRDVTERAETEHQLRESAGKLRLLSRRLVQTQEAERQNLGRELHDRVGQDLTALSINLDILFSVLGEEVDAELRRRLADCLALVDSTSHSIEDVLADLRPPLLEDYGLGDALRWYAKKFSQRTLIAVELHEPEGHLFAKRPVRDTALFRIVQGALTNVAEHAGANRVEIAIRVSGGALVLDVSDNGRGFVPGAQTIERPGWGLRTMYERAEAIDARLSVSSAPGRGTTVTVTAPL